MSLSLSFHGAARTVTGSRHLLEAPGGQVLIDAGMFQGLKKLRLLNWQPPSFDPREIEHVLLTHTHVDHAGYLPRLVREGYGGPVHCTLGTEDLARIILTDAARIQEEDAEHANRRGYSKHSPALPLFTSEDAEEAIGRLRSVRYDHWIDLGRGLRARFFNAGHILGSASIEVRIARGDREVSVVFSGDLGKYDMPLHPDPTPPPPCDFLVVESTYGNRVHDDAPFMDQLAGPLRRALERGGIVLIPAFAVARAQLVTLVLREAMKTGKIPEVPLHIDSPMAVNATKVYSRHLEHDCLDPDLVAEGRERLFPKNVEFHRSREDSMRLNTLPGPRIIISSSGMLTGGRVLHHLRRLLPDAKNLIVLVGYQAAGTRGRLLLEGRPYLKMHGKKIPTESAFLSASGLSGHADKNGLLRWARSAGKPSAIFVVHGEAEGSAAFAKTLEAEIGARTFTPELGESFDLETLLGEDAEAFGRGLDC